MNRWVKTAILLAMLLALLAGCTTPSAQTTSQPPAGTQGGGTTPTTAPEPPANMNATGLPIVKDKITLSVMQYIRDTDPITMKGLWYAEKIEQDTNIHIEYNQVNASDWNTQINLMFSSNQYTDLIVNGGTIESEIYGVDQGILLPVNDLVDQYMPVYKSRLEADTKAWASLVKSDGNMYAVGYMADYGSNHDGEFFINKKWLDELNLPIPTTTDELYTALKSFLEVDPNRTGYQGTFLEMYQYFPIMWGVPENEKHLFLDDNKQVVFSAVLPEYRMAIEYMHKLYSEGLMDPAAITQDSNMKISKYNQMNIGMTTMHRLKSMGWDVLEQELVFMLAPAAEGYTPKIKTSFSVAGQRVFFTKTNQYLPESARWVDYQLEDQPTFESFYGPEGTLWNWNAEGKCELGPAGDQGVFEYALGVCGIAYMPSYYYNQVFKQPDYREERIEYSNMYRDAGYLEKYPQTYVYSLAPMGAEDKEKVVQVYANIKTLFDQAAAEMIMYGVTDDKWNAYVTNLENAGYKEYVALYQKAVDAYFADNPVD